MLDYVKPVFGSSRFVGSFDCPVVVDNYNRLIGNLEVCFYVSADGAYFRLSHPALPEFVRKPLMGFRPDDCKHLLSDLHIRLGAFLVAIFSRTKEEKLIALDFSTLFANLCDDVKQVAWLKTLQTALASLPVPDGVEMYGVY